MRSSTTGTSEPAARDVVLYKAVGERELEIPPEEVFPG